MAIPNWLRPRQKDLFSRKELRKLYKEYPTYVVDFVYESFFMGSMVTLSYVGTPMFATVMSEYAGFMEYLADIGQDEMEAAKVMRDALIRKDLQDLLDSATVPNA